MANWDKLLTQVTTLDEQGVQHQNQFLAIEQGKIAALGPMSALKETAKEIEDCQGALLTPGLIDCHTHLIYKGSRASEFKLRLEGASYEDIARAGGGILSTVKETRGASEDELVADALPRIMAMRQEGVLTVEIKSGYGLDLQTELTMLRAARRLGNLTGIRVFTTFLGAHALPPEFKGNAPGYIDFICTKVLPAVAEEGLADAVDVFCENIGFSLEDSKKLFTKAQSLNLPVKCHAEQLSNMGASKLAAEFGALSVDHLEHLSQQGIEALKKSDTVAVLLPGAFYFLKETKKPPIDLLRQAGIKMAIATDCNPGSSPTTSLRLMMSMACILFGFTVPEAFQAVTIHAAQALGLQDTIGSLAVGKVADLLRWSLKDSTELCYHFGSPVAVESMIAGSWSVG